METVIIGDVHGTLVELEELLQLINYNESKHRLLFAGDLVDRGDYPRETVQLIRSMGVECVMGNHDEKLVRWRRHEAAIKLTGRQNPMKKQTPARQAQWESFSDDEIQWLENLPVKIHIQDDWWLVHGGCEPGKPFDKQHPGCMIRCRYVGQDGKQQSLNDEKEKPIGSVFWAEVWDGKENIIYGHNVDSLEKIRLDTGTKGARVVGIDTGCVFGGRLTAYFLNPKEPNRSEIAQIQAKKEYAPWIDRSES